METLHYLTVPYCNLCLTLPYTLPYLMPYLVPYLALPCLALYYLALPYLALPDSLPYLIAYLSLPLILPWLTLQKFQPRQLHSLFGVCFFSIQHVGLFISTLPTNVLEVNKRFMNSQLSLSYTKSSCTGPEDEEPVCVMHPPPTVTM